MSERSYTLVQQWLQESAVDAHELEQLASDKPYFSAAQLLLLKRLDATSDDFAAQKKVAALHVYNPIQLEERESFDFPFEPEVEAPVVDDAQAITHEPVSVEEKEIETFEIEDEPTHGEIEFIQATPSEEVQAETGSGIQKENETFSVSDEAATDEAKFIHTEQAEVLPVEVKSQKENETFVNSFEQEPIDETDVATQKENETFEKVVEEERNLTSENENISTPEKETGEPIIKLPQFDLKSPVNAIAGDITFEPFHTVDYFASQGIKLSQTEAGNDRFGRQVKSFTEWLKTMKKLPTTAITQNTDAPGEKKVVSLAAHSLQNADVVTESMAEVWLKQGNIQKASEVYNKLSLQNPSKKAYFAAKIESLKKPS
ncbi:MAG: hypothetical protein ACO1NX_06320 [Chitinophagaceae bacterium]